MKFFGIALMVFAIAIAVIPQFSTCEYNGKSIQTASGTTVPMKCKWTAQAELGLAIPIVGVGALMTASRRKESKRNLAIAGGILGIIAIMVPTQLIGVCSSGMPCNLVMKPSLIALGSMVTAFSAVGVVMAQRKKE